MKESQCCGADVRIGTLSGTVFYICEQCKRPSRRIKEEAMLDYEISNGCEPHPSAATEEPRIDCERAYDHGTCCEYIHDKVPCGGIKARCVLAPSGDCLKCNGVGRDSDGNDCDACEGTGEAA